MLSKQGLPLVIGVVVASPAEVPPSPLGIGDPEDPEDVPAPLPPEPLPLLEGVFAGPLLLPPPVLPLLEPAPPLLLPVAPPELEVIVVLTPLLALPLPELPLPLFADVPPEEGERLLFDAPEPWEFELPHPAPRIPSKTTTDVIAPRPKLLRVCM
jgi:hypothetical protein